MTMTYAEYKELVTGEKVAHVVWRDGTSSSLRFHALEIFEDGTLVLRGPGWSDKYYTGTWTHVFVRPQEIEIVEPEDD